MRKTTNATTPSAQIEAILGAAKSQSAAATMSAPNIAALNICMEPIVKEDTKRTTPRTKNDQSATLLQVDGLWFELDMTIPLCLGGATADAFTLMKLASPCLLDREDFENYFLDQESSQKQDDWK